MNTKYLKTVSSKCLGIVLTAGLLTTMLPVGAFASAKIEEPVKPNEKIVVAGVLATKENKNDGLKDGKVSIKKETKFRVGSNTYTLIANGNQIIQLCETAPVILKGRILLPLREISESLGAIVAWNEKDKVGQFELGSTVAKVKLDSKIMTINDNGMIKKVVMDSAPTLKNNHIMVSVRCVAEALGFTKDSKNTLIWDNDTKEVTIKIY